MALAGFLLLVALQVIHWSARYYALSAFLLLLAGTGAAALLGKVGEKRPYKPARVVWRAVGMAALFFVVLLPAILFPQYRSLPTTGGHPVATATDTYVDKDRTEPGTAKNRSLNVEFWYPGDDDRAAPQTCPLILFSHGATGIKTSNESLYRELASHGYVVCSIDHTGQCLYTTDKNGHTTWIDREFLRELSAEDAEADKQQSYAYYQKWMDVRVGDINFVMDRILDEAAKDGAGTVYRLVDRNRIGVMGHSLGGSAALGIGRARADVGAVIALESPFLCDIEGVEGSAFAWNGAAYPVPVLNVYSDSAWSHLDEWPQYAENAALLSSGQPTAFNVHIGGAGHFSLTDLALASPFFTNVLNGQRTTADAHDCLGTINKLCLAFFDRYLKGQGEFMPDGTH